MKKRSARQVQQPGWHLSVLPITDEYVRGQVRTPEDMCVTFVMTTEQAFKFAALLSTAASYIDEEFDFGMKAQTKTWNPKPRILRVSRPKTKGKGR